MSEKINVKELKNLFAKIKNNNNTAFEELYSKYSKLIYKIAYSILKNKSDAEDVMQLVFEKIYSMDKKIFLQTMRLVGYILLLKTKH